LSTPRKRLSAKARRELIEQAALDVFAERGYHGAAMDEDALRVAVRAGVIAVPMLAAVMLVAARQKSMGRFAISGGLRAMGWLTTAVMAACVAGMAFTAGK